MSEEQTDTQAPKQPKKEPKKPTPLNPDKFVEKVRDMGSFCSLVAARQFIEKGKSPEDVAKARKKA